MSGVKQKYRAYKARKVEAEKADKAKKEKVKFFKEQFGVKLDDKDWAKVLAGMNAGMVELQKWVTRIEGLHGAEAANARADYNEMNQSVTQARAMFAQDPRMVGTQIRDAILPDLRDLIDTYRQVAKNTPVTTQVGARAVPVFWTDIPGYDDLDPAQAKKVTDALAQKVARGLDAYDSLAAGNPLPANVSAAEATDLVWAMKSKAQEKGGAFAKGALTIPNGEEVRAYLDKCPTTYPRASSHLKEQQTKSGQSARGMDFYNGTAALDQDPPVVDGMLPFGMNTVLFQQVTGRSGEKLLYIKMETEGAPGTGGGNHATDPTAPPDPPPPDGLRAKAALKLSNAGKTVRHGGNYVKSRISKDEPDKDLKSTREEIPKPIKKLCEKIIKDMPKGPEKAALASAFGQAERLNTFFDTLETILQVGTATFSDAWLTQLDTLTDLCLDLFPNDDMDNRFGGEVSLSAADLA